MVLFRRLPYQDIYIHSDLTYYPIPNLFSFTITSPPNMSRATRSSSKFTPSEKPSAPRGIDLEIGRHDGMTVALEATPDCMQASKKMPSVELQQEEYELTKENGRLRLEVRYHQQLFQAVQALREDAKFCAEKLETAILAFDRMHEQVEDDWYQATEGMSDSDFGAMEGMERA